VGIRARGDAEAGAEPMALARHHLANLETCHHREREWRETLVRPQAEVLVELRAADDTSW